MKLYPWIPPIEIVERQDVLCIWAEAPANLRDDVQTSHSQHRQDTDFEDKNAQGMDGVFGVFTWSFSLKK